MYKIIHKLQYMYEKKPKYIQNWYGGDGIYCFLHIFGILPVHTMYTYKYIKYMLKKWYVSPVKKYKLKKLKSFMKTYLNVSRTKQRITNIKYVFFNNSLSIDAARLFPEPMKQKRIQSYNDLKEQLLL